MYKGCVILLLAGMLFACQTANSENRDDAAGLISSQALLQQYPQFNREYQAYQPTSKELQAIGRIEGKTLVVLFGTWCHDSEREVPRLLKTLAIAEVNLTSLRLLAVSPGKQLPKGEHRDYGLRYTPTFILFDSDPEPGDLELGRVIERPVLSVAEDLAAILAKN